MKNLIKISFQSILLILLVGMSINLKAQDELTGTRMKLTATQLEDNQYLLEALLRARIDKRYVGLKGLEVSFSSYNEDGEAELGTATTDEDGIATLKVSGDDVMVDSTGLMSFASYFEGNDIYEESDGDVEIIAAEIEIETSTEMDEDSVEVKTVTIYLTSQGEPVEDATIYLQSKAMIRPLPIADDVTDEDGMVTFEFPNDLPGDKDGNVFLLAKVDDNPDHGYMLYEFSENWGIPVRQANIEKGGSLSSPNPPLWLLITFLALLVVIWGHYLEIIYKLFKIKKKNRQKA